MVINNLIKLIKPLNNYVCEDWVSLLTHGVKQCVLKAYSLKLSTFSTTKLSRQFRKWYSKWQSWKTSSAVLRIKKHNYIMSASYWLTKQQLWHLRNTCTVTWEHTYAKGASNRVFKTAVLLVQQNGWDNVCSAQGKPHSRESLTGLLKSGFSR